MPKSNVTGEKMTEQEKQIEELAEALLERDVLACQSSLVDELIKNPLVTEFNYEQVSNLYPDPTDWSRDKCLA